MSFHLRSRETAEVAADWTKTSAKSRRPILHALHGEVGFAVGWVRKQNAAHCLGLADLASFVFGNSHHFQWTQFHGGKLPFFYPRSISSAW